MSSPVTILYQGVPVSATNPLPVSADAVDFPDGMPAGGTGGQVLTKDSEADYDATWQDLTDDLPVGGAAGQVLVKNTATDYDATWGDVTADIGAVTATRSSEARTLADRFADSVHLLDFIPVAEHAAIYAGTSTYDASDAMDAAIASVGVNATVFNVGGPEIILPYGKVHFDRILQLKSTVILKGHGRNAASGTVLEFAAGLHGIIVHRYNTFDIDKGAMQWGTGQTYTADQHTYNSFRIYECTAAGPGTTATVPVHSSGSVTGADGYTWAFIDEANPTLGADASVLRDFEIKSLGGTIGHGVWLRARACVENVWIRDFAQNGLHIHADATVGGIVNGNANNCYVAHLTVSNCDGDGVHIEGGDANAGSFVHIDVAGNRGCGVHDASFLGNSHFMCHTNGNGFGGQASHGGNRYYVLDETVANATEPGVVGSEPGWQLISAGGVHPLYPAWSAAEDYVAARAFKASSNNAVSAVFGLYVELGQPPSEFIAPWIVVGTQFGVTAASTGLRISAGTVRGTLTSFQVNSVAAAANAYETIFHRLSDEAITMHATGDHSHGLGLMSWDAANACWKTWWARSGTASVMYTGSSSVMTGGRTAALGGGEIMFPRGLWVGQNLANSRKLTNGIAAPTTGEWAQGDIVFDSTPVAGAPMGWMCVTGGTPGTWAAMANLV